jgi:hypothetical protein
MFLSKTEEGETRKPTVKLAKFAKELPIRQ